MIFSFEKMALRDAVKSTAGAEMFARGLHEYLHGTGSTEARFTAWVNTVAALKYGFDFHYASRPNWQTYRSLLDFAAQVRPDMQDLGPRDMIDIQSFMWVQGSSEYD